MGVKNKKYKIRVDNKMHGYGVTDFDKHLITINKKLSLKAGGKRELVDSIVHEKLHAAHPTMSEKRVKIQTEKVEKKMGQKARKKLLSKLK